MAALFFYLCRNREAYEKAVLEVRNSFPREEDLTYLHVKDCTYLRACIDEALRLSPPVPGCLWRQVLTGTVIEGHYNPPGTWVGTCNYSINRNAEYWPRPHEFIPERWLPSSETPANKQAFHSFQSGSRSCIGQPVAIREMMMTFAMVLWRYDMRLAPGVDGELGAGKGSAMNPTAEREDPNEYQLWNRLISCCEGPNVQFRARKA